MTKCGAKITNVAGYCEVRTTFCSLYHLITDWAKWEDICMCISRVANAPYNYSLIVVKWFVVLCF